MKKIWDYFQDNYEYPKEVIHNPIPYGTVWTYISSTFLNGFINYTKPIAIFLLDRYTPHTEWITDSKVNIRDCSKNGYSVSSWYKFEGTKGDLIKAIISGEKEMYHTDLGCFNDDIIILGEIENHEEDGKNRFIFFWFDMDCSDCSIGKIETEDDKETVIQSIKNWLNTEKDENPVKEIHENFDSGIVNYTELPLSFIKGWVKF